MEVLKTITLPLRAVSGILLLLLIALIAACTSESPTEPPRTQQRAASTVDPEIWPRVQTPIRLDQAVEARIDKLLASMTLEQKVGQLIQADIGSITPDDLRKYPLGSILNGGNSGPGGNDLAPAREWLAAADAFYEASLDPAHGPNPIPVMWGTDAVHGHSNIIGATIFPHNIGLGATRNVELIRRIGEITAREVAVTGQDWTFAPTLAVVRDDRWGRSYEGYSEDPEIVSEFASAMVIGLQGEPGTSQFLDGSHVLSSAKHFIGDGGTKGQDQGDNTAPEAELRDIHGAGYPPAIEAGVQIIMASFSSWQGVKLHGHRGLLTDVLKTRMGFDGFVVGDWNGHGQVAGCTNESCPAAINAGLDMFMAPDSWRGLFDATLSQVKAGVITQERLDDAVRRILRVKIRAGILDKGKPSSRPLAGKFELLGAPEHRAVARQAVRESLVLLKNANGLLPLSPRASVLVAGDGADNISKQSGGWTLTWQGTGVTNKHFPGAQSIYAGIRDAVRAAGGRVELRPDGNFTRKPDVAIVVFGENPYAEFQGDLRTVAYRSEDDRDLRLLRKLKDAGIPVVSVFLSGRPLWVNREINASDAFVAAWLPGSEGGGIADVLFRKPDGSIHHDFKGRLSFSWPGTPLQWAVHRDSKDEMPLFPYGYGLRYSDNGDLEPLPEDFDLPEELSIDTQVYFSRGEPGAGWQWFTEGSATNARAVDRDAQEDGRQLRWSGNAPGRLGLRSDTAIDLRREANGQLSLAFDYRVDEKPSADVQLLVECGADCRGAVVITDVLIGARPNAWEHLKVPLSCFSAAGADMSRVNAPFVLSTAGVLTLSIANVRLETGTDDVMVCAN